MGFAIPRCFFATPKNTKTTPRSFPKGPKRPQEHPKMATPKRPKIELKPEDEKRTEPRRPQDRLGPPQGPKRLRSTYPQGLIWEAKSAPKPTRKRSKIEAKNQEAKKNDPRRSWTGLGAILGRSWPHLGVIFCNFILENVMCCEN